MFDKNTFGVCLSKYRGNARDECQSYTGADLWNPEYSDESEFLSNHLSYLSE